MTLRCKVYCDICDKRIKNDNTYHVIRGQQKQKIEHTLSLTTRGHRKQILNDMQMRISSDIYVTPNAGGTDEKEYHFHRICLKRVVAKRLQHWFTEIDNPER